MNKFFKNITKPSMNEMINWFQITHPDLVKDMLESTHHVNLEEPNSFHLEGPVWTHTMMVCLLTEIYSNIHYNKINILASLLHDIGKPKARDEIPFEQKKPVHSESNEVRNNNDSTRTCEVPKSGIKVHFRGHEGLSFFLAIDVLTKLQEGGVITEDEKIQVLQIVSLHGTLFDYINEDGEMKKPHKVFSKFRPDDLNLFNNYVNQVKYDSQGRFFKAADGRKERSAALGNTVYSPQHFLEYHEKVKPKEIHPNTITVLVGPPGAGKSTWLEKNHKDEVILSNNNELINYAKENGVWGKEIPCICTKYPNKPYLKGMIKGTSFDHFGIPCPRCNKDGKYLNSTDVNEDYGTMKVETYNDVWHNLTEEEHSKVIANVQTKYQAAQRNKKDIIVDMTNSSPKSRRKWLSQIKKYNKKIIIFATGYDKIIERVDKRCEKDSKCISLPTIETMMKSFIVPMYHEVDEIEWIF